MGIEQQAQNDAKQNLGMKHDPNWTDAEKERYEAAYNGSKQK